mgnify:CR=1 FL=1
MPQISFNQTIFQAENNEIIYNCLEKAGTNLPHGCLSGSCGACRINVLKGSENIEEMSAVEENTTQSILRKMKENGTDISNLNIRLSCRAKVLGDIEIEILK